MFEAAALAMKGTRMHTPVQRRTVVIAGVCGAGGLFLLGRPRRTMDLQVPEVDIATAKTLIDAGALVVDVRGKDPYDHRHVPGAIWIPLAQLSANIAVSLAGAKDRTIVVYCNDGHFTGPEATRILLDHGYARTVNLKSGIEGWDAAGLPIVRGKPA
jgi:rhodanese-related sulfurtransferase